MLSIRVTLKLYSSPCALIHGGQKLSLNAIPSRSLTFMITEDSAVSAVSTLHPLSTNIFCWQGFRKASEELFAASSESPKAYLHYLVRCHPPNCISPC